MSPGVDFECLQPCPTSRSFLLLPACMWKCKSPDVCSCCYAFSARCHDFHAMTDPISLKQQT